MTTINLINFMAQNSRVITEVILVTDHEETRGLLGTIQELSNGHYNHTEWRINAPTTKPGVLLVSVKFNGVRICKN